MVGTSMHIGLILFPRLTQLDLTGPFEAFARIPGANVHLIWKSIDPVVSDIGLQILPTITFDTCPDLDVLCIPGGPGVNALLEDEQVLAFVRRQGEQARYVTSVCTGAWFSARLDCSRATMRLRIGRQRTSCRTSGLLPQSSGFALIATASPAAE